MKKQGKGKGRRKGAGTKAPRAPAGNAPARDAAPGAAARAADAADAADAGGAARDAAPHADAAPADAGGHGAPRGEDVAAPLARWFLWADSPAAVERLVRGLAVLCALLFVFDVFWHRHAYVPGEGLWGYHAIAGFVSFTLIVLGAKALRTVIGRDEDYYGDAAVDVEDYPEAGLERRAAVDGEEAAELLRVRDARVVGPRGLDTAAAPAGGRP